MLAMRKVMLAQAAGGGGGGGCGVVLATVWDDNFDCGTVIDTAGTRFSGANAWTIFGAGVNLIRTEITGGQLVIETTSTGVFFPPRGAYQTLPAGDWAFQTQCSMVAGSFEEGVGIFVSDGTDALWLRFGNNFGDLAAVKRTGAVSATRGSASISAPYAGKMEISRVAGTLTFKYDTGGGWATLYTAAQTVDFVTAPTRIGVFVANKVGGSGNTGTFDWFLRTA